ncbi:hypothetical protein ACFQ60_25955 [Streptomyces zhihengii]
MRKSSMTVQELPGDAAYRPTPPPAWQPRTDPGPCSRTRSRTASSAPTRPPRSTRSCCCGSTRSSYAAAATTPRPPR